MDKITKTFKITAPPEVMQTFENFLCFLHFNGGHSGLFGMYFDGDGSDSLKCEPKPTSTVKEGEKDRGDVVTSYHAVEIAGTDGYSSAKLVSEDEEDKQEEDVTESINKLMEHLNK